MSKWVFGRNHPYENELLLTGSFSCKSNSFSYEGFAQRLVFKQRHKVTRKWPIAFRNHFYNNKAKTCYPQSSITKFVVLKRMLPRVVVTLVSSLFILFSNGNCLIKAKYNRKFKQWQWGKTSHIWPVESLFYINKLLLSY